MPLWLRTVFDDVCSFYIAGKQTVASLPESPCDSIKIRSVSSRPCEVPDLELHAVRWPGGGVSMRAHVQRLSSCVYVPPNRVVPLCAHACACAFIKGFFMVFAVDCSEAKHLYFLWFIFQGSAYKLYLFIGLELECICSVCQMVGVAFGVGATFLLFIPWGNWFVVFCIFA